MKSCVVPKCYSTSVRNPDLKFFSFPKQTSIKEEWMEALSLKKSQITDLTRICELHFKSKDFGAGRRSLKTHAVPIPLKGRGGKFDPDNSDDDDFMVCDSDSDPEILEVKKISQQQNDDKQDASDSDIKEVPKGDEEADDSTPGRRPSRRAAQLAVKKIHNTVRNLGIASGDIGIKKEPIKVEPRVRKPPVTPKVQAKKFRDHRLWHSIRVPPVDIDLLMECHEELLSATQAEALMKAQSEYNTVMKTLRAVKASNTRIVCMMNDDNTDAQSSSTPPPAQQQQQAPSQNAQPKLIVSSSGSIRAPNLVTLNPVSIGQSSASTITVVPVRLVTVHASTASGLQTPVSIMKPSSPSVTLTATSNLNR